MAGQPVEWVLVVYYGRSAHRATYGRLSGTKYTKDYIQLSRKPKFLEALASLFPVVAESDGLVPLTYQWPTGSAPGALVLKSADRPHLKWETNRAPQAWKMSLAPSEAAAETIPGDPEHLNFIGAESEYKNIAKRGAGQPYLLAIKLRDEPKKLHLRVYLKNPSAKYAWADLGLAPLEIQALAGKTSESSALAWSFFQSGGTVSSQKVDDALSQLSAASNPVSAIGALDASTGRALASYLRHPGYGLFFDSTRNHDAWSQPAPLSGQVAKFADDVLKALDARFPPLSLGDAAAEASDADPEEVEVFRDQIEQKSFEVPDSTATVKTRGSAQKAYADAVKANYGYRCAITGIVTRNFLVASHIVPWSEDQSIRLDPSNGICLSLLVDRAFEKGHLMIEDDLTIRVNWKLVGDDQALRSELGRYDGKKLDTPKSGGPRLQYLQRRRALVASTE